MINDGWITMDFLVRPLGCERFCCLSEYGIEDIRQLFINDQRWLDHYGFSCATPGL
jgi:hypothetical protein